MKKSYITSGPGLTSVSPDLDPNCMERLLCFCCFQLFFLSSKLTFSKYSFRNTIKFSNGLDPDQDFHFVSPYLGPNCLERPSADDISRR